MSTNSTDGRPWAKLSELKAGDVLIPDGGFSCLKEGEPCIVIGADDDLRIHCKKGNHWLAGQVSNENNDSLVGFWRKP